MVNWKRCIRTAIRCSLFVGAFVAALFAPLTAFKWPIWIDWMAQFWTMGTR
jgi:hypothetical protein